MLLLFMYRHLNRIINMLYLIYNHNYYDYDIHKHNNYIQYFM